VQRQIPEAMFKSRAAKDLQMIKTRPLALRTHGLSRAAWLVALGGLALAFSPAVAQNEAPAQPVNPGYPAPDPAKDGEGTYPVSRFLLEYEYNNPDHPDLKELFALPVSVGVLSDGGFTYPREGVPTAIIRVGDFFGDAGQNFYPGAIKAVNEAIAKELVEGRKLIGVTVIFHPDDIDWETGADRRDGRKGLRLKVFTAAITDQKAKNMSAGADPEDDDALDRLERIRIRSPLNVGNLVRRDVLDDYVLRLNRHPGRRVNVAVVPNADQPGQVEVQYLVSEVKPWSLYAQVANIGTKTTGDWRERLGFVHTQLTNNDDVLRVDFLTTEFSANNALFASYERPLSDNLTGRVFGSWSEFSADAVGIAGEQFKGENWSLGAEVSFGLYQTGPFFLDGVVGGRFDHVMVDNTFIAQKGEEDFFLPYAGVRFDRSTEAMNTSGSILVETSLAGATSVSEDELTKLGRIFPDKDWTVLKYEVQHSMYLEPLMMPKAFADRDAYVRGATLAHELFFSLRGQEAFGKRLIPTFEGVAGGMYSVRGYPESVAAGDTTIVGTVEYRFHLPRVLLTTDGDGRPTYMDPSQTTVFGKPFRVGPAQAFDRTDWDLIFKGFLDVGRANQSDRQVFERDHTLVGAGVGLEFQFLQNVNLRLDWGFALQDVRGTESVDSGDSRVHLSATFLY
jgi:hypothetical protein